MRPSAHSSSATAPQTLRGALHQDHQRLDKLFSDLLAAFQADARIECARLWNAFDVGLRTHLQLEEQDILPEFAKTYPEEAAALEREHARIRQRLLELGVGVDLHLTRDFQVEEFLNELRTHAAREDALMYQWAEKQLSAAPRGRLQHWLKRADQPQA